jgi:hypothetical protein
MRRTTLLDHCRAGLCIDYALKVDTRIPTHTTLEKLQNMKSAIAHEPGKSYPPINFIY